MITDNLIRIKAGIPEGVTLVAVSKYHPLSAIQEAYQAGQRIFGESRAQDLIIKAPAMPSDTKWHFIGHLQTNKVRSIIPYVDLIHSVDSLHLLQTIEREAARADKIVDFLFQAHVAMEETKFGLSQQELAELPSKWQPVDTPHVRLRGLMGMASNTDDERRIRADFMALKDSFQMLQKSYPSNTQIDILSMGMSDDHLIAIECGSTMVRVGSSIFSA